MLTEIGEYIVGAYLALKLECDVMDCNVQPLVELAGLQKPCAIGLDQQRNKACLCEMTARIRSILHVESSTTVVTGSAQEPCYRRASGSS